MRDSENLEKWRKDIRAIDEEILTICARRMDLSRKIGEFKLENGLPVKHSDVEQEIIARMRKRAESMSLDPLFAENLITLLMDESVRVQLQLQPPQG